MKILWKQDLDNKNSMPSGYENNFLVSKNSIFFACSFVDYENTDAKGFRATKIIVYDFNKITGEFTMKSISFKYEEAKGDKILLSKMWKYYFINDELFLYVGKYLAISSETIKVISNEVHSNVAVKNLPNEYIFEQNLVKYNGRMSLECLDNISGSLIWKHKLRGISIQKLNTKKDALFLERQAWEGLYIVSSCRRAK